MARFRVKLAALFAGGLQHPCCVSPSKVVYGSALRALAGRVKLDCDTPDWHAPEVHSKVFRNLIRNYWQRQSRRLTCGETKPNMNKKPLTVLLIEDSPPTPSWCSSGSPAKTARLS